MSDLYLDNQLGSGHNLEVPRQRKGKRGGWRPGSGRKPILDDPVSFTGSFERADIEALDEIAEERGVSVASLVREAVSAYLARRKRR